MTPREYRYLGPDGVGIGELPDGIGAALGSEYCVHLLPSPERLVAALRAAAARRAPVLLLTPYFRDAELKRSIPLFRSIPAGVDVDVAINDWGALRTVRSLFPTLRLSVGRLLSGQKRCPRIGVSPALTEEGKGWHGEGIFGSPRARAFLVGEKIFCLPLDGNKAKARMITNEKPRFVGICTHSWFNSYPFNTASFFIPASPSNISRRVSSGFLTGYRFVICTFALTS